MRIAHRIIFSAAVAAMTACATPSGTQNTVALSGRIDETFDAAADAPSSPGVYQPGMGGAVGGAVAGLLMWSGKEPAHTIYVLKIADDSKRYVRQREKWPVGACVAVVTDKTRLAQESWKYGEAHLKPSTECK